MINLLPVIALVGRPNVGKSTLFNRMTKSRDALVANLPGLTRDRQYGHATFEGQPYIVIDTGGISGDEVGVDGKMAVQSLQAAEEADVVLFLTSAKEGITSGDHAIVKQLRAMEKTALLVVNKTDGINSELVVNEFFDLGFGEPYPIAATQNRGVLKLLAQTFEKIQQQRSETEIPADAEIKSPIEQEVEAPDGKPEKSKPKFQLPSADEPIKMAIIGRPNVGKSTLVNRMLGEERVVVFDLPGTTRDSIYIDMERRGQKYTLIDTAGVRKRGKIKEAVEKFSVVKTLQAIESAHVVIMVIDAREGVSDQDMSLLGFVIDSGRSLVIAINKWDGLDKDVKDEVKETLKRRLQFVDFAKTHFISALHGTGVGDLFNSVVKAYRSAHIKMTTGKLTDWLIEAQHKHQPPLVHGRRIKLRMAHAGGHNPPWIIIHGNQTASLPLTYQRYLSNFFRDKLKLVGTPVRFEFKSGDNPFKGKKNVLSDRQKLKKERNIKYHKKKQSKK